MTREYPLPSHLSEMFSVSFKVTRKAILFVSGESESLYKSRGHGFSGKGSMKLSMMNQFFLLGLYNEEPSRPLCSYVTELYKFSGTKVSTSTISKWYEKPMKGVNIYSKKIVGPHWIVLLLLLTPGMISETTII